MPVTSAASAIKAGTVAWFAASTAPAGFIKANGAAVSRSLYAALFNAIGTTYGVGDGSTTFNVPDLRGEFLRGFDDGRGVDSGRVIGTAQTATGVADLVHQAAQNFFDNSDGTTSRGTINFYQTTNNASIAGSFVRVRPRNVALLACIKF